MSEVVHYLNPHVRMKGTTRYQMASRALYPVLCGETHTTFAEYLDGVTCAECRIRIVFMVKQQWLPLNELGAGFRLEKLPDFYNQLIQNYFCVRENGLASSPTHAFNRQELLEHAKVLEARIALMAIDL